MIEAAMRLLALSQQFILIQMLKSCYQFHFPSRVPFQVAYGTALAHFCLENNNNKMMLEIRGPLPETLQRAQARVKHFFCQPCKSNLRS